MDQACTLGRGVENGPFFLSGLKYLLCYKRKGFLCRQYRISLKEQRDQTYPANLVKMWPQETLLAGARSASLLRKLTLGNHPDMQLDRAANPNFLFLQRLMPTTYTLYSQALFLPFLVLQIIC